MSGNVFFRISSGLKNILGRDLITNDFVAIFELVKNSFDAHANNVWLIFRDGRIFVADDGKGMTSEEIRDKWLFVAYSAKEEGVEDENLTPDYRDGIDAKRHFAGNKGVGRFSCDRLGGELRMQSKSQQLPEEVAVLDVSWNEFEKSLQEEFAAVPAKLATAIQFDLPIELRELRFGTILEISDLRDPWDRDKLLALRRHLEKLINPFDSSSLPFRINIICDRENPTDEKLAAVSQRLHGYDEHSARSNPAVVNGQVKNLIFEELANKTTYINVQFDETSNELVTRLVDRSEEVYLTRETHSFETLAAAKFSCTLFFLNRAAKATFARRMGLSSVSFGSVFLFKNNFRIFPIGEEGVDTFGIDRRKQQGYARYLGSRDLVGRIDIFGVGGEFKESTSRDQGLIKNDAFAELERCFMEVCFRRLEAYVVDVTWPDKPDKDREDISGLLSDSGKARVVDFLQRLTGNEQVKLVSYSDKLVSLVNERSETFENVVNGLKNIAKGTDNEELLAQVERAQARYTELKESEALARELAEKERLDRVNAEAAAQREREARLQITDEKAKLEVEIEEEKKRNLFLTASTSLDHDTVVNLHHQIVIYASEMQAILQLIGNLIRSDKPLEKDDVATYTDALSFHNSKILAVSKLATKANFRIEADVISTDLAQYIEDYVTQISGLYSRAALVVTREPGATLNRQFRPIEISMLVDNLISNSDRAKASEVKVKILKGDKGWLQVQVSDNGLGLAARAVDEPQRVFEKGFSTTHGSGLGLFHVTQIMEHVGGSATIDQSVATGFSINLYFPEE